MKTNAARRLIESHKLDHVWTPGLRSDHAATGALVIAGDTGNCLLQLRAPGCDTPNTWGQFGGSIDGNEEVGSAFRRELKEEAGYVGKMIIRPLMAASVPKPNGTTFTYYNLLALVPQEFVPRTNWESKAWKWFDPQGEWPSPLHPGLARLLKDPESMKTLAYVLKHRKTMKA